VRGYLATPAGGNGPGVLVLHAWWGLNEVFTGVCDKLAQAGFVAFAPDMFAGRVATTAEEAETMVGPADSAASPLVSAAVQWLRDHPATTSTNIGVIGFSFGAAWATLLATALRADDIGAVVLYYGVYEGLDTAEYEKSHAAFQGHFAPGDEWTTDADVEQAEAAMRKAGRATAFYRYDGTKHWFFEPDRPEYDAAAAALAWERTVAFLRANVT
jgi:carboxymethylenebutenolidase